MSLYRNSGYGSTMMIGGRIMGDPSLTVDKSSLPSSDPALRIQQYADFCSQHSLHRTGEQIVFTISLIGPTILGFLIGIPYKKKAQYALIGLGVGAARGLYYKSQLKQKIKERCGGG